MFISKKKFNSLAVDLLVTKAKVRGIELTLEVYCKQINEVIDNNKSIIDTNKIVIDKLEEIIKANNLE